MKTKDKDQHVVETEVVEEVEESEVYQTNVFLGCQFYEVLLGVITISIFTVLVYQLMNVFFLLEILKFRNYFTEIPLRTIFGAHFNQSILLNGMEPFIKVMSLCHWLINNSRTNFVFFYDLNFTNPIMTVIIPRHHSWMAYWCYSKNIVLVALKKSFMKIF